MIDKFGRAITYLRSLGKIAIVLVARASSDAEV